MGKQRIEVDIAKSSVVALQARASKDVGRLQATWTVAPAARPAVPNVAADYVTAPKVPVPTKPAANAAWKNDVELPPVGAQTYSVLIKAGNKVQAELELVTHRKLPVTVYSVSPHAKGYWEQVAATVQAALEPAGVKLGVTPNGPASTDNAGFYLYTGDDKQTTLLKDVQRLWSSGALPAVDPPAGHLRIILIEKLVQLNDVTWEGETELGTTGVLMQLLVKPVRTSNGKPVPIYAKGRLTAGYKVSATETIPVAATLVDADTVRLGPTKVEIDKLAGRAATITVTYETEWGGFFGWSNGKNLIVAATRAADGSALTKETVAGTIIHELGHALGQTAASRRRPTQSDEANPRHYIDHGGTGHHCSTGAKLSSGVYVKDDAATDPLCIMLHANGGTAFCDSCKLNLKLADLTESGPRRSTWTA